MPDVPLRGKQPFTQHASTVANGPRRVGSIRVDTPVLESVARRADEDARATEAAGAPGFRGALLRARTEASAAAGSGDRPVPSPLRPRPTVKAAEPVDEQDERWLQNWQANEIRWLNSKVEDLERQLRHRKVVSGGAVAVGGLALVAAVVLSMALQERPEAVIADIETPLSGETPVAARSPAAEPHRVSQAAPPEADPELPAGPSVAETAGLQALRDDQEARTSPGERAPLGAASTAGDPGREVGAPTSPRLSGQERRASASERPAPKAEPWQAEAERALMALVEPDSPPDPSAAPEPSMEITDLLSRPVRADFLDPAGAAAPFQSFGRSGADSGGAAENAEPYAATAAVNLRDGPSTEAEVLAVVSEGDRVRGLGSEGDWLLVQYDEGDGVVTGWVYSRFLHRVEGPPSASGPSARSDG
jgi:Bacterial SH3 domain